MGYSELVLNEELLAKRKLIVSLMKAIEYEERVFSSEESTDEDKRIAENRLREIAKELNDTIQTQDHAYMVDQMRLEIEKLSLECEKLEAEKEEARKNRKVTIGTTIATGATGLGTTVLGYFLAKKQMEVAKDIEDQKYIATVGEKEAIRQGMDVHGIVQRLMRGINGK